MLYSTNRYELDFKYAGVKKITLPLKPEQITPQAVSKNFSSVISAHQENARKIKYLLNFVDGEFQPIDNKTRKFESAEEHNNKTKMNHAYALVTFKEGFILGEPREFAQKSEIMTDDLKYLDKFLTDINFFSKDLQIKHNMYATGIATSYVMPRTEIIMDLGDGRARYKTKEEGYDADNDSPFLYECIDSQSNAVVYSSYIGQEGDGTLFCFNQYEEVSENNRTRQFYKVFAHGWTCVFDDKYKPILSTYKESNPYYDYLPMVEHSYNFRRIGIVEMVYDLLNNINTIISCSIDNIVDVVNQILVFINCEIENADKLIEMLEKGAVMLPPTYNNDPKIDKISLEVNHEKINILLEQILTRCYDIVGVPLASANVTSGGDTGEARLLGGGWTNAYTIIKRDILAMQESDRAILKRFIDIAKLNPANKLNEVSPNQVDIKYNINMTDNLMSKTQGIQNLVDVNMPFEDILRAVPLFGDVKTVASRWAENVERLKNEQQTIGQEANMDNPSAQLDD